MQTQEASAVLDETSRPYEGRWGRLISTTNWEKGKIILQWREALKSAGAPGAEYSDEAWSQRVGGVSGQHVGRLRRVYERFGEVQDSYAGLYWSHFQAASDWDDAEMWLEGAVQNSWSVSQMRKQRWETLGAPADMKPRDEDIISGELNEDLDSREDLNPAKLDARGDGIEDARSPAGPDFGDDDDVPRRSEHSADFDSAEGRPTTRPFENLAELPTDLAEAFDAFKLAIIRHKADGWREIPLDDLLSTLDALKQLALAPSV